MLDPLCFPHVSSTCLLHCLEPFAKRKYLMLFNRLQCTSGVPYRDNKTVSFSRALFKVFRGVWGCSLKLKKWQPITVTTINLNGFVTSLKSSNFIDAITILISKLAIRRSQVSAALTDLPASVYYFNLTEAQARCKGFKILFFCDFPMCCASW